MIRRLDSKPCCKAQQLLRGYDRLRLPQPHVHANRRNKASPFMTGPFVPVGILNPIRAVVGIPIIDSTFSSNALGPFRPPTSTNGLRASRSICERGQGGRHDFGRPALKPATHSSRGEGTVSSKVVIKIL